MATATSNYSEQRGGGRRHREGDALFVVGGSGVAGVQFQREIKFEEGRPPRHKFQVYCGSYRY